MELVSLLCTFALLLAGGRGQDIAALKNKLQSQAALHNQFLTNTDAYRVLEEKKMSILQNVKSFWPPDLDLLEQLNAGNASRNLSAECLDGVKRILHGTPDPLLHLPLVVRMVDAMGRIEPGYFEGNKYAYGAYDECLDIGPGEAEYCNTEVNVTINLPQVIPIPINLTWEFGLCVPRGCTPEDVHLAVESITFGEAITKPSKISCMSTRKPPYNAGAIVMIIVCCILAVLMIAATVFDFVFQQLQTMTKIDAKNIQEDDYTSEKAPLLSESEQKPPKVINKVAPTDFIVAFSLLKVVPQILSMKQPPSAITSINGLRVMSMFWVILCHTHFWVMITGANNTARLGSVLSRFSFQAIGNAFFSVDSFFFLSGLLVAYLSMRQMKRKNGRFPFLSYYLHRYLRLTPTYAFVLFFIWFLSMHLADGPIYNIATGEDSALYQNCKKYWWTNLLYINNLYPWHMGDECVGWTWYLANDMQFYIFSPLILIPLYFVFPLGLVIAGVVLVACFIATGAITGVYDLQANTFAYFAYGYFNPNVSLTASQDLLYIKPWHRVAPYIVGLVLGYVLYRLRLPAKRTLYHFAFAPLLFVSALCLFWTLYGLYFTWHGHTPTLAENVIYNMFSRTVWSVGLALLVFVCHYGYGGIINTFLSMKFWIPLSRVSYNAYLVHPLVLTVIFGSERKVVNYQDYNLVVYALGIIVLSYGVAAVVSVFVEFPIGNLEQAFFKLVGIGGRESARTGGEQPEQQDKTNQDDPPHVHHESPLHGVGASTPPKDYNAS